MVACGWQFVRRGGHGRLVEKGQAGRQNFLWWQASLLSLLYSVVTLLSSLYLLLSCVYASSPSFLIHSIHSMVWWAGSLSVCH